ncbi:ATP-binding protein [Robbsia sp. Bb-Pol-6]|uniref:histidine kinase n=1 Tax=Robbsia betulipollinis TaxID=2981849 RepID=A0ABT3ZK83_9BURK|nr:ATP-binding protein [Robbsia betulipollinis]MCY0386926.1 ATP-binding protein [Robbsia betulipollinis]
MTWRPLRLLRRGNTLFVQYVMVSVALLGGTQLAWVEIVGKSNEVNAGVHISGLVDALFNPRFGTDGLRRQFGAALGIRTLTSDRPPAACPMNCAATHGAFESTMLSRLPAHSHVTLDRLGSWTWVRYGESSHWAVIDINPVSKNRLLAAAGLMFCCVIVLSLLGAWLIQKPMSRLSRAASRFRAGSPPQALRVVGAHEVKELTRNFNAMTQAIHDADRDRAEMLAGMAHDLRAPLTRALVCASMIEQAESREQLVADIGSMSRVIDQFLTFARVPDGEAPPDEHWTPVDAYCRTRYGSSATLDEWTVGASSEPAIQVALDAGDHFCLPILDLERLLDNLVGNAFAYGATPIVISTAADAGRYVLAVRDHGAGIPDHELSRAVRPFVRLDEARGGAHSGLGLAIVQRLARRHGGVITLTRPREGGLLATVGFPRK